MKRVAISQSNYIPWQGYFDLIHDVDVFVFLDDVQFTKNDWRNRNKVKTPTGVQWLTIPVGDDLNRRICDVTLPDARWQSQHWKTLRQLYARAPFFGRYREFLEHVYLERRWATLSELNQALIQWVARDVLRMSTTFRSAGEFSATGRKQDRVMSLLEALEADVYVSGPAATAYLDVNRFTREGIELVWKEYSGYPEYRQFHPPFVHEVTILDLLFHTGPDAPYYVWAGRAAGVGLASAPAS